MDRGTVSCSALSVLAALFRGYPRDEARLDGRRWSRAATVQSRDWMMPGGDFLWLHGLERRPGRFLFRLVCNCTRRGDFWLKGLRRIKTQARAGESPEPTCPHHFSAFLLLDGGRWGSAVFAGFGGSASLFSTSGQLPLVLPVVHSNPRVPIAGIAEVRDYAGGVKLVDRLRAAYIGAFPRKNILRPPDYHLYRVNPVLRPP